MLQLVTSTDRRGAETFAVDLGRALESRGTTVRTVALAPGQVGGLDLESLGERPLSISTIRAVRSLSADARIVVAHGSSTLPACALALPLQAPFIYRSIGDPRFWASNWRRRARTAAFLLRARAVVALSAEAGQSLHSVYGVPPRKVHVIPNAVAGALHRPANPSARDAARHRLTIPHEAVVATTVGALSVEKGVDVAIEAIARLPQVHLLIAGDGPLRHDLEERAGRVAPDRVHFLGAVEDPGLAFDATDVFLLPSRTEGQPASLIEAGLRALPAVATDVGYVRDILIDGEGGVVVAAGDPAALASGIERALTMGPHAGEAARARCLERFEMDVVAAQWQRLLDGPR